MNSFDNLPPEILVQVTNHLEVIDLAHLSQASSKFKNICENDLVWKEIFKHKFPTCYWKELHSSKSNQSQPQDESETWKSKYQNRLRIQRNWKNGICKAYSFDMHKGGISSIQFGERYVVSGSADCTVAVIDLIEKKHLYFITCKFGITCLQLDEPNMRILCGGINGSLEMFEVAEQRNVLQKYPGHTKEVHCVKFDNDHVISGSADKTIRIFETSSGNCLHVLIGHRESILCVQTNQNYIFSGSKDSTIRIWSRETGLCLHVMCAHSGDIYSMLLCNHYLYSGSLDCDIRKWNLEKLESIGLAPGNQRKSMLQSELLTGTHHGIIMALKSHQNLLVSGLIIYILYSDRNNRSGDRCLAAWDTASCKMLYKYTFSGVVESIDISVDNQTIVCSSDCELIIAPLYPKEPLDTQWKVVAKHDMWISSLQCNEDIIVCGSNDGILSVVDFRESPVEEQPNNNKGTTSTARRLASWFFKSLGKK